MGRVKTFTNGGSLLPGDLNSIEDDYEFAFSTYKPIAVLSTVGPPSSAATWVINQGGQLVTGGLAGSAAAVPVLSLDPAEVNANTRASKYLIKADLQTNATAIAVTLTVGLYPVSSVSGSNLAYTLGTVIAGSTVPFTTPGASSQISGSSGDFTAPASGNYTIGVVASGAPAANSAVTLTIRLLARQV